MYYGIRNEHFHLFVDATGEVFFCAIDPRTDYVTVECEYLSDLQTIVTLLFS